MGKVNTYPTATVEDADLILGWDNSASRVIAPALTAWRTALITGAASTIATAALTASRALASDGDGKVAVSTVTTTELQGLHGLTASRAIATNGSGILTPSAATGTELGYLSGVTSALQTQLNNLNTSPVINLLNNGNFDLWDRGTSLTPANDVYVLPAWNYLRDVTTTPAITRQTASPPDGSRYFLRWASTGDGNPLIPKLYSGLILFLEAQNSIPLRNLAVSLSFSAKYTTNAPSNFRVGILSWSSTADSVTSNVVSSWNTTPTLAANWAYENTPASFALTTAWQRFSVLNCLLDTAGMNNIAVFFIKESDNTASTINVDLAQVQLQLGAVATSFVPLPITQELSRCRRRYLRLTGDASGNGPAISAYASAGAQALKTWLPFPVEMRIAPTTAVGGTWNNTNCTGPTLTNVSAQGAALTVTSSAGGICSTATNGTDDYLEFDAEL